MQPFVFDESQIRTYEDGARPWDRLTHIWRSWFALDNLNGVTAVMLADRRESRITVREKEKFQVAESQNRLETCLNVAVSLGDNITSGLTGLLLFEPSKDSQLLLGDIARRLESEKIDAGFQIVMKRLFQSERCVSPDNLPEFLRTVQQAMELALRSDKREELEHVARSLRRVMRRLKFGKMRQVHEKYAGLLREAIHPRRACEVAMRSPQAAVVLLQLAKESPDLEWSHFFLSEFTGNLFGKYHPMEMMERDPDAWIAYLQTVREVGGWCFLDRHDPRMLHHEFFERAFHSRHLLELSERNPEAALAWVQLAREVGGGRFLKRQSEEMFDRWSNRFALVHILRQKPAAFAVPLRLAQITESHRAGQAVLGCLLPFLRRTGGDRSLLGTLPLTALPDLQWLAKTTGNPDLVSALRPFLNEIRSL